MADPTTPLDHRQLADEYAGPDPPPDERPPAPATPAEFVEAAIARGDTVAVLDATTARPWLTPADETDARLAAGEDIARAARQDATVRRLREAGDPSVRSPFYGDGGS